MIQLAPAAYQEIVEFAQEVDRVVLICVDCDAEFHTPAQALIHELTMAALDPHAADVGGDTHDGFVVSARDKDDHNVEFRQ